MCLSVLAFSIHSIYIRYRYVFLLSRDTTDATLQGTSSQIETLLAGLKFELQGNLGHLGGGGDGQSNLVVGTHSRV